jgi:hypothetical protein
LGVTLHAVVLSIQYTVAELVSAGVWEAPFLVYDSVGAVGEPLPLTAYDNVIPHSSWKTAVYMIADPGTVIE